MRLTEYKHKRHFSRTPEPAAKTESGEGWRYVIQKHDASRLHYDFRLELDGVLKSWAVPKGPSLDPSVKRLAVQVEDHPVAYRDFEGIIPEGEYGGGTVMLWDTGHWEPVGDPHQGLRSGKLKFQIHGEKLNGGWTLVRTRIGGTAGDSRQWLLIKERDEQSRPASEGDVLEELPLSIASGRDLKGIANSKDRVWSSKNPKTKAPVPRKAEKPLTAVGSKKAMPKKVEVQLATLTDTAPPGDEWLHEIKFDGYRMICRIDKGNVQFISRNQQDWTSRLSSLVRAAGELKVNQAILDGEAVVLSPDGTTDFQSLQNAFRESQTSAMKYIVFDLLYLDGQSLMELPLAERKENLKTVLPKPGKNQVILYSDHIRGGGDDFKKHACRLNLEGMISKRADQSYRPGRSCDWLKIKCIQKDEFVIGGYTEPSGSRSGFGALLVGFHDPDGKLRYAGKVGTGFDERCLHDLSARLKAIEQPKSPFSDLSRKTGDVRSAHWVKPTLIGQFVFGSRTRDGHLRHASFQGLREDKSADEVTEDKPMPVKTALKKSAKSADEKAKPQHHARVATSLTQANDTAYDSTTQTFQGVRLTHPEKVLYPDDGITKLELAEYYRNVSDWLLPHVKHRPIVLVRCPDGQKKECFFQKHPGIGTPTNLRQIPIQESNKTENYLLVDNVDDLISLAQVGALELHAWGSREDKLEFPDRLIFDLDPAPEVDWKVVVDSARQIRKFLEELGLRSFVKTTGGKGLHLVIPIDRRHDWDEAKAFCKKVAETIQIASPTRYTANMSKSSRTNRIFIDYLRNGRGATAVMPYSPRSRPGAPVSVPLTWDELSANVPSNHFTIRNVMRRLESLSKDPWEELATVRQSLAKPIRKLDSITAPSP